MQHYVLPADEEGDNSGPYWTRHQIIAMDKGFCAIMQANLDAGFERLPIVSPITHDVILRRIAAEPQFSGCGSPSAAALEWGHREEEPKTLSAFPTVMTP